MIAHKLMGFGGNNNNKLRHRQTAAHGEEEERNQCPTLYCRLRPVVFYCDRVLIQVSITAAGSSFSFKSIKTHKRSQTLGVSHVSYMWHKFTFLLFLRRKQNIYI